MFLNVKDKLISSEIYIKIDTNATADSNIIISRIKLK